MEDIKVLSARALTAPTKQKIQAMLDKRHGKKVDISYEVDSSLLGGILIIDGDDYFDGTLKSELLAIRKQL